MAKKNPPDSTTTGLLDNDEPFQLIDEETKEIITNPALANAVWIRKAMDPQLTFFDALTEIPVGGWDVVNLYLYRLEPKVANREGQEKYIGCFGSPITQESVKTDHGGGKYQLYLKAGKHTLRSHRFWIDGEPRYLDGQTVRGGPMAGTPLTGPAGTVLPPGQDIASIVRQVIEATGGNSKAADAGIDVMTRAFNTGLDLQKSISTKQLDSATGSTLGDKLFEMMMPKLLAPSTPDPMMMKLFEAFIADRRADRREPNPAAATPVPPSEQFALVKEVFGVESLRDVFDMTRGGKEQPWWVAVLSNAIEKLPTILNEFAQMQERGFQRAVIAHQLGAAQALPVVPGRPGTVVPAAPVIPLQPSPIAVQTAPVPSNGTPVGTMSEQMIQGIVEGICRAYDEGYPGDMAAVHLKLLYPQLVDSLRPLLSDPVQLANFVRQTSALAERASEEDWPGFQQEFIEEVRQVPIQDNPPGANESRIAAEVPHGTPAPVRPVKPAAAPRKKANGAVA
jgi:hypothetical protein